MMLLQQGQKVQIRISGMGHQGQGVGRRQDRVIFVPGALPDELIRVQITDCKKNYARGKLLRVLEPSSQRLEAACPYYGFCGGCELLHCSYAGQLAIKEEILASTLTKIGALPDIGFRMLPIFPSPRQLYYRNRCQLHCHWQAGRLKIGFFAPTSHKLQEVEHCLLLAPVLNQVLEQLPAYLGDQARLLADLRQIILQTENDFAQVFLTFVFSQQPEKQLLTKLSKLMLKDLPQIKGIAAQMLKAGHAPIWLHVAGADFLREEIGGLFFHHKGGAFLQVNPAQTEYLYQTALAFAAPDKTDLVLDLYCGIGTISLLMARQAQKVIGIEEFAAAISQAKLNAKINGIKNADFRAGKVEQILPQLAQHGLQPQVVMLDPPRAGCNSLVISTIAKMKIGRIVYVSCDPGTLARDLRLFTQFGYLLQKVQPVDMFPQTSHVECVVLMSRVEN
jgi:23S rRNA (uracil1939-C5)-methyltransferase